MPDTQELSRVLRRLARTMAGGDIHQALYDLSDGVADVVDAAGAGVALLDHDVLRFVAATADIAVQAERSQEQLQSGPCIDAIRRGDHVVVSDVRDYDDVWPDYAAAAEAIGLRSVLVVPLTMEDQRIGSLDVYGTEPRRWSEDDVAAVLAIADIGAAHLAVAAAVVHRRPPAGHVRVALDGTAVIEQARGVLARRAGISADEALQRIRRTATGEGAALADVCRRVVETGGLLD